MSARHFSKYFSPEEADRWLPRLRQLFLRIHETLERVGPEVSLLRRQLEHRGNGGGIDLARYRSGDAVLESALQEIQGAGIVIQEVGRGLVDFPHLLEGREVFLCWELEDGDRISWFHELHAGYAGRRAFPR